jgi:hypothetical protein
MLNGRVSADTEAGPRARPGCQVQPEARRRDSPPDHFAARPMSPIHDQVQAARIRLGFCRTTGVNENPTPIDLSFLASRYGVASSVVEDLYARRRAGARDSELIDLLQQRDRGGLDSEAARALVSELPAR